MAKTERAQAQLVWAGVEEGVALLRLSGRWTLEAAKPDVPALWAALADKPPRLRLQAVELGAWDSSLLALLRRLQRLAEAQGLTLELRALPAGAERLLPLPPAVPPRAAAPVAPRHGLATYLGLQSLEVLDELREGCVFCGCIVLAGLRLLRGRARMRGGDFWAALQQCGPGALPIVALIASLVGLILAFVGAAQLQTFGAQLYIANMVSIGMTREMGALMTAVIMAGRTGAAYAAELGSMQANEEIDALKTFGFPPLEFLVLPRLLALLVSMPLLCVFADALGVFGGFVIGAGLFDISAPLYLKQSLSLIGTGDFLLGIFKSLVFAALIGLTGCHYGLRCGRNAQAVGQATTRAVVSIIVWLVIADALITLICTRLGI